MINRFLAYFGCECEPVKKTKQERFYGATTVEAIKELIPDIDDALNTKAEVIIAKAKEISLKDAAHRGQEQAKLKKEWEEKHQAEVNKRVLETQFLGGGSVSPISIEKQGNTATTNHTQYELNKWDSESISEVTQMLALCDSSETLTALRQCEIPVQIFQLAARKLPTVKRNQIREWVMYGNLRTG